MRSTSLRRSLLLLIGILVLLPWMLGTTPLPGPYHQYVVHGTLDRAGARGDTIFHDVQSTQGTGCTCAAASEPALATLFPSVIIHTFDVPLDIRAPF